MGFVPQGDSMRVVFRRAFAVLAVLILTAVSFVPVTAQSSDSVVVTGSIVAAPLSITISNETIAFGALDYRATPQTPAASATGFVVPGNSGAQWVANTPLSFTVVSPNPWSASACVSLNAGLPNSGLYIVPAMPVDATAASLAFQQTNAPVSSACPAPTAWTMNNSAGESTMTRYFGTWVQSSDTVRSFSATVQITVSN
jgi:hypothetical protein